MWVLAPRPGGTLRRHGRHVTSGCRARWSGTILRPFAACRVGPDVILRRLISRSVVGLAGPAPRHDVPGDQRAVAACAWRRTLTGRRRRSETIGRVRSRAPGYERENEKLTFDVWKAPKTGEWILSKGDDIVVGLRQITSDTMRRRICRLLEREEQ